MQLVKVNLKKYDYDKGADWWLKKNAKKFGYNYSFVS